MEPWESHILAVTIPLVPVAGIAYAIKSRVFFVACLCGSILGQTLLSPFVMASFDTTTTRREQIVAHVVFDLPYTSTGTVIAAIFIYFVWNWDSHENDTTRSSR